MLNKAAKYTLPLDELTESVIHDILTTRKFQVHSSDVDRLLNLHMPFEAMPPEEL